MKKFILSSICALSLLSQSSNAECSASISTVAREGASWNSGDQFYQIYGIF